MGRLVLRARPNLVIHSCDVWRLQAEIRGHALVTLLEDFRLGSQSFDSDMAGRWAEKYALLWELWTTHQAWKVRAISLPAVCSILLQRPIILTSDGEVQ
jgi:hypothetical protein